MRYTLSLLALLGLGMSLHADVVPAQLFTDNAVLQRDKPIPVRGTAAAGEKICVTFAGEDKVFRPATAAPFRSDTW